MRDGTEEDAAVVEGRPFRLVMEDEGMLAEARFYEQEVL